MFIDKRVLTDIFAPAIWAKVQELNKITHSGVLTAYEKKVIKQKLKASINHELRMWEEEQPKMVSCGAKSLADTFNKINGTAHDITKIKYPERHIFGGTTGKPNIMFDHTTPVNETVEELTKCSSLADIVNVLNNTSEVCIITRFEDDLLNKKGYRSMRPGGWEKCYSLCEIKICFRPNK